MDIAVQQQSYDIGEPECPPYTMAETLPLQSQSIKIRRPAGGPANESLSYVPLKSAQEGSHMEGASLFNAPVNPPIAQLDVPYVPVTDNDPRGYYREVTPQNNTDLLLKKGIRPGYKVLKLSELMEPSANLFRTNEPLSSGDPFQRPHKSYDIGAAELRRFR
jgi:hypothetical protein